MRPTSRSLSRWVEVNMTDQQSGPASCSATGPFPMCAGLFVTLTVIACSVYANLSFGFTDPADYRFFPPFTPYYNANGNTNLGGECYQIAKSMVGGEGIANPFKEKSG